MNNSGGPNKVNRTTTSESGLTRINDFIRISLFFIIFSFFECASSALISRDVEDVSSLIEKLPVTDRYKAVETIFGADKTYNESQRAISVAKEESKKKSFSLLDISIGQLIVLFGVVATVYFAVRFYLR